jgi:O-antigen ligase
VNRIIFILLIALLVLAPLPLGSNREWSWTLCAFATAVMAILWSFRALARPAHASVSLPATVYVPFLLVCAWVMVQVSHYVPADWHHPVWRMAGEALGMKLSGSISLAREDTLVALLRLLSYGLVFFLSLQLCADRKRAALVFKVIALAGLAYALFGLAVYWGDLEPRLWFRNGPAGGTVRGPFVNRNHFATYLGLCVLCALAGTYRGLALRRNPAYSLPTGWRDEIEHFIVRAWKPLAALLLMVSALILTHSRAGFGAFVVAALVLTIAVTYRQKFAGPRSLAAIVAAFAVTITAFVLTSEILLQRMDNLGLDAPQRLNAYALASQGIDDNPWLGFGYGTFADSFRLYRDGSLTSHVDRAHNTYLENVFELGWPAAMLLFLAITRLAVMCLGGLRRRGRDWIYPATGLAATALVATHSLFDFSLQIPANAITYAVIMGVACAQSLPSRQ